MRHYKYLRDKESKLNVLEET